MTDCKTHVVSQAGPDTAISPAKEPDVQRVCFDLEKRAWSKLLVDEVTAELAGGFFGPCFGPWATGLTSFGGNVRLERVALQQSIDQIREDHAV